MSEKSQTPEFHRHQLLQLDPDTKTGDQLVVNEALLGSLMSEAHSKEHVPVVSFIGGAGVGKSSLVCRLLEGSVDAAYHPNIAAPNQILTETAGVYIYPCTTLPLPNRDSPKALLADFEGAGGQIPRAVNQRLLEEVAVVHWLHAIVSKHIAKRKKLTMKTLPTLAFLLSDVVVYVHQSPVYDIGMLQTLAAIAEDASEGVYCDWKPALIVLKNKNTASNFNINDVDITESFLRDISRSKELQKLYQSVRFMSLPHSSNGETFKEAVNVLKSTIGELCSEVTCRRMTVKIPSFGVSCHFREKLFWSLCGDMLQCINDKLRDADSTDSYGQFSQNLVTMASKRLGRIDKKSIFFDRFFTQVSENIFGLKPDQDNGMALYRSLYDKLVEAAIASLTESIAYTLAANASIYGDEDEFIDTLEPEIQSILETSTGTVESYSPCRAESPPLEDGETFSCTLTAGEHGEFHENPDARISKTSLCFMNKEEDCSKWEGEFEGRTASPTSDDCIKQIQQQLASKSIREIAKSQAGVLQGFKEADLTAITDVCTLCFCRQVGPPLPCGHRMCEADRKLLTVEGRVECPFDCREYLKDGCATPAISVSSENQETSFSMPESKSVGVRVLALDGGGVKGVFQTMVLERIYERITPLAPEIPFRELFDLIIGTSVGSAAGAAIGRMNFSPAKVHHFIAELPSKVFVKTGWRRFSGAALAMLSGNIYSHQGAEEYVKSVFGDTMLSGAPPKEDSGVTTSARLSLPSSGHPRSLRSVGRLKSLSMNMLDELKEEYGQKTPQEDTQSLPIVGEEEDHESPPTELVLPVVACCTFDLDKVKPVTISGHDCSMKTRDAVLASTAAPTFFPAVQLMYKGEKRNFCDGGIGANCPVKEGKKLAKEVWPDRPIDTMLSVGCGGSSKKSKSGESTLTKLGSALVKFAVRTEQLWNDLEKDNDCFVRLNSPAESGIGDIPIDSKDIAMVHRLSASWLDEPETQRQLDHTACMLSAKFFYLKCPDEEVLTWQPGQECRLRVCQRKARFNIQSEDLRAMAKMGHHEMPCEVQHDADCPGGFLVTFHCPRRPFAVSVHLCMLGTRVEVSGSPLAFNVTRRGLSEKWIVTSETKAG